MTIFLSTSFSFLVEYWKALDLNKAKFLQVSTYIFVFASTLFLRELQEHVSVKDKNKYLLKIARLIYIFHSTCIRAQLLRNKTQDFNRNGTGSVVQAAKNIVAFQRLLIAKKTRLTGIWSLHPKLWSFIISFGFKNSVKLSLSKWLTCEQ